MEKVKQKKQKCQNNLLGKLRALYDTKQMVKTMLKMDYVSDEETERNRTFEALGLAAPMDKKTESKLRKKVRNK